MSKHSIIDPILMAEAVVEQFDAALPPVRAIHAFWSVYTDPTLAMMKVGLLGLERTMLRAPGRSPE